MRMPHWSSTSFGYMNPWTDCSTLSIGCPPPAGLPHRAVETVVVHLRAGRHLRLQDEHVVFAQELVDRLLRVRQVARLPGARRARLAARGRQPLRAAVVAERALVHRLGARVDEPAAVGTRLHAVATPQAVRLVDQHDAIRTDEGLSLIHI